MKKYIFTIIITAIIFTGCQKENTTGTPETQKVSGIEQRILNFEQQLNSAQKEGTTYAIDSAVWYVEALINYNLGSEGVECKGITVDTAQTNLPIPATGEYTLSQLETVYNQLLTQVQQNQPEGTIMFAADLYNIPVETVMVFYVNVAYATPVSPGYKALNDTSGYWFWGYDDGMCGPDYGNYIGKDAADVLENKISNTTSDIWCSLENRGALPDSYIDPNFPFDITYLDSTRMFMATGPGNEITDFCIPPNVMDYYLSGNGIWYIINDLKPSGKRFAYCRIYDLVYPPSSIAHVGLFTYGIPVK